MNINQVILVDDDIVVNFFDKVAIGKLGIADEHIHVFQNVPDALRYIYQLVEDGEYHGIQGLIFLDIKMPELDGWDFLALYKKLPQVFRKHFHIYILTSEKLEDTQEQVLKQHHSIIKDFLQKPLTIHHIEDLMR